MLAAIGGHYGCPLAELDAMTDEECRFWHGAAAMLHEKVRERS